MGYVTVGTEGAFTSWTGTVVSAYARNIIPATVALNPVGETQDVTGLNATAQASIPGLRSWSGNITGYAKGTTPSGPAVLGHNLAVEYAPTGGYILHVRSLQFNIQPMAVHDITNADVVGSSGGASWKAFRPDRAIMGTWSYEVYLDDTTRLADLPDTGATLPTLALTYNTTAAISGSAIVDSVSPNVPVGGTNTATISGRFTGAITPSGANSIFGTVAFAEPEWPKSSASPVLLFQHATGRTYSGVAFWTSLQVTAAVNAAVSVNIGFQGTGELTTA